MFHGDQDTTVHPNNGQQVVSSVLRRHAGAQANAGASLPAGASLVDHRDEPATHTGVAHDGLSPGGRRYTRSVYGESNDTARVEYWVVHGAGHAWSGGHASGSYTDPNGPNASQEMLRFFLENKLLWRW